MSKKCYILDTNVLINDPSALIKFAHHDIVIPLIVVYELDGLKKGRDSRGQSARQALTRIDDLRSEGPLHEGVPLGTGGTLTVTQVENGLTYFFHGQPTNDHYILQAAIDWRKKSGQQTILVTEDKALRILADTVKVEVERYQEFTVDDQSIYDDTRIIEISDDAFGNLMKHREAEIVPEDIFSDTKDGAFLTNEFFQVNGITAGSTLCRMKSGGKAAVIPQDGVYGIKARNREQHFALDALMDPRIHLVALAGHAGTGKTVCALATGLQQVTEVGGIYSKMTICRPTISMGKEIGFLPGSLDEKLMPWMGPIIDSLDTLFERAVDKSGSRLESAGDKKLQYFRDRGMISIEAISYIRGRSLPHQFLLVDESQNLSPHEVKTIITRAGVGTKIVLTGDPNQVDLPHLDSMNCGLSYAIDCFQGHACFASVTLKKSERSHLADLAATIM